MDSKTETGSSSGTLLASAAQVWVVVQVRTRAKKWSLGRACGRIRLRDTRSLTRGVVVPLRVARRRGSGEDVGDVGQSFSGSEFRRTSRPAEEPNLHNESDSREGSSRGNEAERRHGGGLQIAGAIEWRWGLSSTSSRSGLGIAGQQASVSGLGKERCLAMTEP
jgi:hypothetical protein